MTLNGGIMECYSIQNHKVLNVKKLSMPQQKAIINNQLQIKKVRKKTNQ